MNSNVTITMSKSDAMITMKYLLEVLNLKDAEFHTYWDGEIIPPESLDAWNDEQRLIIRLAKIIRSSTED